MTESPQKDRPVAVRIPPDLRDYMQIQAQANFRSLSSELASRIERTRQEDLSRAQQPQGAQQ